MDIRNNSIGFQKYFIWLARVRENMLDCIFFFCLFVCLTKVLIMFGCTCPSAFRAATTPSLTWRLRFQAYITLNTNQMGNLTFLSQYWQSSLTIWLLFAVMHNAVPRESNSCKIADWNELLSCRCLEVFKSARQHLHSPLDQCMDYPNRSG